MDDRQFGKFLLEMVLTCDLLEDHASDVKISEWAKYCRKNAIDLYFAKSKPVEETGAWFIKDTYTKKYHHIARSLWWVDDIKKAYPFPTEKSAREHAQIFLPELPLEYIKRDYV